MDFFKSDDESVDAAYLDSLNSAGLDEQTRELLLENHKMCNAKAAQIAENTATRTFFTNVHLPKQIMECGTSFEGPCLVKCDVAGALRNVLGAAPKTCVVTRMELEAAHYKNQDPSRKLKISIADGAAGGMYMQSMPMGHDGEEESDFGGDKSHLITLTSGMKLSDVGAIYDQSDFLESPVYTRYRDALESDPHQDRTDYNSKLSPAASFSYYTSPYMRNVPPETDNAVGHMGKVKMTMETGQDVFSEGDCFVDLVSKNLSLLPNRESGARPVATWVEAGPGEPAMLQIKATKADTDDMFDTLNNRVLADLKAHTIDCSSEGSGLVFKMQTERGPGIEDATGEVVDTDWSPSTEASLLMKVTVAYNKSEIRKVNA